MAEFKPINTQEELDTILGERLRRERESISKQYGDYDSLKQQVSDLTKEREENAKKYAGYDQQLAERDAKIKGYETSSVKMRIAREKGIPYELAERLSGETEDDIRKDADSFSQFIRSVSGPAPLFSNEPAGADPNKAALEKMLQEMEGE